MSMNNQQILDRIDDVLKENQLLLLFFCILTGILFLCGIVSIIYALCQGQYVWTIPSAFTTLFLKWPIEQIVKMRDKNIALATVPALITGLSEEQAAEEIQKLIEHLYGKQK